jgi:hypothetical protein
MQKLRSIHLYLGCLFAPLLLFFAISGIWQTLGFTPAFLQKLSSIHTEHRWKDGTELGSLPLRVFIILMAVSFVITTALGIVMAFRFGRSRRAAWICLGLGVMLPSLMILARIIG